MPATKLKLQRDTDGRRRGMAGWWGLCGVECSVVNAQAAAAAAASDGDGRTCTLYRIIIMGISMFST